MTLNSTKPGYFSSHGDAGMAHWYEHSPPTTVARVQFLDLASHVGWVCCWFSSVLQGFFSGFSRFHPSTNTNTPNSHSMQKWGTQVCQLCWLPVSPSPIFFNTYFYERQVVLTQVSSTYNNFISTANFLNWRRKWWTALELPAVALNKWLAFTKNPLLNRKN